MTAVTPRQPVTGCHAGRGPGHSRPHLPGRPSRGPDPARRLLHADKHVADGVASYRRTRPDDPAGWVCWVAGVLGEHAAILRDLTTDPLNGELP